MGAAQVQDLASEHLVGLPAGLGAGSLDLSVYSPA